MLDSEVFAKAERVRDVIRYARLFKNATVVIHIDDTIIDSPIFASHIRDICLLHEVGMRVIIIPAARRRINQILNKEHIPWTMHNGCRITGEEAMPLIKMAAFDVSNRIMTSLATEKRTAVIGNWVRARGKGVQNGTDFATSGEIDRIQIDAVETILQSNFIPIFPCIGWSSTGKPYNISSLQLAAALAVKINADKLFFLTQDISITAEKFAIPSGTALSDEGCIPALKLDELPYFIALNEKACESAGTKAFSDTQKCSPKKTEPTTDTIPRSDVSVLTDGEYIQHALSLLRIGLTACRAGVARVHILNGSLNGTIPCEIFSDFGSGTMIYEDNYGGIRNMTLADIPDILNLIRPFVEEGILLPRTEEQLSEQFRDFIVYELDAGIRACAALHVYDNEQGEIAAVAVDKTCSHIGVGPKLVNYLISRAKQQGLSSVFVLTTRTADWFEQLGFIPSDIDTLPEKRRKIWSQSRGSKALRLTFPEQ